MSRSQKKNQVIFGQNHLIFDQAMEKIFGQETSAPPWTKLVPYAYATKHKVYFIK